MPRRCSRPNRVLFAIWCLFLGVLTLVNQADLARIGDERTPLFDYKVLYGLNVTPIELAALACTPIVIILSRHRASLRHIGGARLAAAVCCMYIISAATGFERLGHPVGMAEAKALTLTSTFVLLATEVYYQDPSAILSLPSIMVILCATYELAKLMFDPYVDPVLGATTHMSQAAVFHSSLALVAVILSKRYRRHPIVAGAAILGTAAILVSNSRTSILYLSLSGAVALAFRIGQAMRRPPRPIYIHAAVIAAAGAAVLFGGETLYERSAFYRELAFWRADTVTARTNSNRSHLDDVQRGLALVAEAPVLGQGFGGALPEYGAATFSDVIHNEFLHFWAVLGVVGAGVWLFVFVVLPVRVLRSFTTWNRATGSCHPATFVAFLTVPYALTRASVFPAFFFDTATIWLVANMLALEAIALGAHPVIARECAPALPRRTQGRLLPNSSSVNV